MRLKGKVAIVTGAANGIGQASALRFAMEGARVVAVDIDDKGLEETAARIRDRDGEVSIVTADVSRQADVSRMTETAVEAYGGLDTLLHAAGIASFQTLEECDEAEWDRVHAVNSRSAFLCAKAAAPLLRQNGGGSIVFVSSINGIVGAPGLTAYSASKGAMIALMRTLALELAPDKIRVNCLCPASVDTPMLRRSFDRAADPKQAREKNIARHPLGRLGTPDDVASFALFLASDESSFVTGGTHLLDGGAILARR